MRWLRELHHLALRVTRVYTILPPNYASIASGRYADVSTLHKQTASVPSVEEHTCIQVGFHILKALVIYMQLLSTWCLSHKCLEGKPAGL